MQDGFNAIVEEADSIIGGPPEGKDPILSSESGTASARRNGIDYFAPVPDYRRNIFARQPGVWESFNRAVWDLPDSRDAERIAYPSIFAAEGGSLNDKTSSASSGILQSTLDRARGRGVGLLTDLENGTAPRDLSLPQRAAVYRDYFDDILHPVGGHAALDEIGDYRASAAFADTLFRHGIGDGTKLIQETNNDLLRLNGMPTMRVDGRMGYGTLEPYRYFASRGDTVQQLLDVLGNRRSGSVRGLELDRINFFRFLLPR